MRQSMKWIVPLLVVFVGTPLILLDYASPARGFERRRDEMRATCLQQAEENGIPDAAGLCGCILEQVEAEVADVSYGATDTVDLPSISDRCLKDASR